MTKKRYQSDDERQILIGAIVHDRVLSKIASRTRGEKKPFRSKWSNLVYGWCLEFHAKYQRAPQGAVIGLFNRYAESSNDEDTTAIVEKFLSNLSDDYAGLSREINEDYLVDCAARLFNTVKVERHQAKIQGDLDKGDLDGALVRFSSFTPFTLATTSMVDVLTDKEALRDALRSREDEVLIQFPGALGEFFGEHLARDGFIAFLAPEKRGKSFWLIDFAWNAAIKNRRRTLLYSVGDMSQRQMMRRVLARAARRPLHSEIINLPKAIRKRKKGVSVRFTSKEFNNSISVKEAARAMKRIRMKTAHSTSLLKMKCTANSTTRVIDIEADIEDLSKDGWVPEVLVLDYADILAPERNGDDVRHQIDETWRALRRLSQKYHMLVITATQSKATSYDTDLIRRQHFSEDKRKLAHVTGMAGINQTEEEKEKGIFRLNWVALREGVYYESKCVTVAGCLEIASPAMVSTW